MALFEGKKKTNVVSSAIDGLRMVIKYGAYIIVIIDIINYAITKLESVAPKEVKEVKEETSSVDDKE